MTEIERIQDVLRRTYDGHAFYGDPILEILARVDARQSVWIPEGGTHCIWQIVRHMTVWLDIIRRRLTSPTIVEIGSDEENFPTPPTPIHDNWNAARDSFKAALDALIQAVGEFPPERLDAMVPERHYTFYVLLQGAAQHSLYHAGQIALMHSMYKKLGPHPETA